jgi:WD40-like Beta Propeller Repeat
MRRTAMPSIDDQLRTRMRESAPRPAGADDLVERLAARKRRRATLRKAGTVGLVVVVLFGTAGAFVALGRAFDTGPTPATAPAVRNGALVVNVTNEDAFWLYVLPTSKQDLTPSDGAAAADREVMRHLVGSTGADRDVQPAVSPDGTTVAFVHHDFKGPGSLWLVNIDGTDAHRIVPASADVASPAWSSDGRWIAFGARTVEGQPLGLIRSDGTDLQFPVATSGVENPSWSPDGSRLVYSVPSASGGGSRDLWEATFDEGFQLLTDVHQLTSTPPVDESDPTWSPDGSSIAYVTPDGIEQIPATGGSAQLLVPTSPTGDGRVPTSPAWSPDGAYLTFVLQAPLLAATVYVQPTGSSDVFPLAQGFGFAWQPVSAMGTVAPSLPTQTDLGLGYPVCRVSSMPITIAASSGTAYVFTKEINATCPKASDGTYLVGVDVTGDGNIDATSGPLTDCFSPAGCEAFAAPDVNGDGTSEIAVSTAGADGYGVWLYTVTADPPTIEPVRVELPTSFKGFVPAGPLQFAWVDVVGHFGGAHCVRLNDGSTDFVIVGGDKLGSTADVRSEVFALEGSTMRALDAGKQRLPLSDLPLPGRTLCGTPLYGSASAFPNAA